MTRYFGVVKVESPLGDAEIFVSCYNRKDLSNNCVGFGFVRSDEMSSNLVYKRIANTLLDMGLEPNDMIYVNTLGIGNPKAVEKGLSRL